MRDDPRIDPSGHDGTISLNELAHPAATDVVPIGEPKSRWTLAAVAVAAFGAVAWINLGHVPALVASHWVPMFLLASGCMAAMRWKRAGVRNTLRSRVASKVAEFGGGVYGAAAMATWLQLEGADLVGEVAAAGSLVSWVQSLSLGWLISQAVESIGFAVRAGLWPWHWFSGYGMQAVLLAAGAAVGLDALLKAAFPRYRTHREAPAAEA